MTKTPDLFDDQGPAFEPQPERLQMVAGKVVATMHKPSVAQKRFNTLMADIQAAQAHGESLRRVRDTLGPAHHQALREVHVEDMRVCKSMVTLLDAYIQAPAKPKGLTANQKQQAIHMLLTLLQKLGPVDDTQMHAIAQRYVDVDEDDEAALHEQEQEHARAMIESMLGEDFTQGRQFDSPEEMLRAALEFEEEKRQKQAEKREAKRAASRAKKPPTAAQLAKEQAAQQTQADAQQALRTVFRQLASALHPDRATDHADRVHRTALMSEVNAAYERRDLSALLRIQLQTELVDASKAAAISEAKLKAMCALLGEQLKVLENDNETLRVQMEYEFGYPSHIRFSEGAFQAALQEQLAYMRADVALMQSDLEMVQDDKALKAWLKAQARIRKALLREDDDMAEMLMSMGLRPF